MALKWNYVRMAKRERWSKSLIIDFVCSNFGSTIILLCFPSSKRFVNRQEYVEAVRSHRLKELASLARVKAILCGFASVIPLQILKVLTVEDLDLRVCGVPHIDLEYLKVHLPFPLFTADTV